MEVAASSAHVTTHRTSSQKRGWPTIHVSDIISIELKVQPVVLKCPDSMSHPASEGPCPPTKVDSAIDDTQRLIAKIEAARAKADIPQYADKVQDILGIIPLNTEARRAFHTVAQSAKWGSLDPLHAQYVCITGERPLGYETANTRGYDSGETEDETPSRPPTMIIAGHYRVNFALPAVRTGPTWVYISTIFRYLFTSSSKISDFSRVVSQKYSSLAIFHYFRHWDKVILI